MTVFVIAQLISESEPQAAWTDNLNVQLYVMNINPIKFYRVYLWMGDQTFVRLISMINQSSKTEISCDESYADITLSFPRWFELSPREQYEATNCNTEACFTVLAC